VKGRSPRSVADLKKELVMGVVLVHGAFHGAWCWNLVVAELERLGVDVLAVELPFTGFDDDVDEVGRAIVELGPDAVVVAHSYGGLVVSTATYGRSDVARLVYVAAFMADEGEDAITIIGTGDSKLLDALIIDEDIVSVDPLKAKGAFYGDLDDASAATAITQLRPLPVASVLGQQGPPGWKAIPSTYVVCTKDAALPPAAQRRMAARASLVLELPTDHSPFTTRPAELAEIIVTKPG
jgi:pimeloyl-ACP methyl ester carboxylesterase